LSSLSHLTSCTTTSSKSYFANSLATVFSESGLQKHQMFHVPSLISNVQFYIIPKDLSKSEALYNISWQAGFYGEEFLAPPNPQAWGPPICLLSESGYSVCLQLPSIPIGHLPHLQPKDVPCHATVRGAYINMECTLHQFEIGYQVQLRD
jgi:hypothetical protein